MVTATENLQHAIEFAESSAGSGTANLPDLFRNIYFHLYTNSKASRAETIIEDLSLLLLAKLAADVNGGRAAIDGFIAGKKSANASILPMLRNAYPDIVNSRQKFVIGDNAIRDALSELQSIDFTTAPSHALGEAFQALMGPRLRGEKGQFFTPRSLVRAMVEIVDPAPNERVVDPACGTGGFLAEVHQYQKVQFAKSKLTGALYGIDKDAGLARLGTALLRILTDHRSTIRNCNSLDPKNWNIDDEQQLETFDVVLTNPPFGAKIGVKDEKILSHFDFGKSWVNNRKLGTWTMSPVVSGSTDPQILFIELCVKLLKPGGRMGIVLPEGVFGNKNSEYVWNWLRDRGNVVGLLDCPRTTFQPGTDTKTNVLFFNKHKREGNPSRRNTRLAVAINCGHDRRGRSHSANGSPHADDFPAISRDFRKSRPSLWKSVNLSRKHYLVPRYYYEIDDLAPSEASLTNGAEYRTLTELMQDGLLTIRKGHEVGSDAYGTGMVPFVRTSDISNFEISSDPTKAVSEDIYETYRPQQNLTPGDVLMVVDGRYRIGTTAMLTKHNYHCVVQSHLRVLSTPIPDELGPYELLFALNLPSVKFRIRNLVFIQSTLGTLGKRLNELKIPILHGQGPWRENVDSFKTHLEARDEHLAQLVSMTASDVEL